MADSETPSHMDRGRFLARLSKVAEDCASSEFTLCRNCVLITRCPPFILKWVMGLVGKGQIPSYNVSVDRGGVLVTFDV